MDINNKLKESHLTKLYDQLHGNYMFYINTNYHEFDTNLSLIY